MTARPPSSVPLGSCSYLSEKLWERLESASGMAYQIQQALDAVWPGPVGTLIRLDLS